MKTSNTYRAAAIILLLSSFLGCGSAAPSHLAFVTLRGPNEIAAFRVNNHSAAFTSVVGSPFTTGVSPSSVVAHPSKKFVYVANQGENNISLFKVNSDAGQLFEVMPRTHAGIYPSSLVMDSGGAFLFAANQASNNISVFSMNSGTGALTEVSGSPFATGPGPTKLRVSPSGKFLYVLVGNLGSIYVYSINSGGSLQPAGGVAFTVGPTPSSFTIDPAEHFLYVTNASTSTVSVFSIDPNSGALAAIPQSPFTTVTAATSTTPVDVVTHPSGQFLYVLNSSPAEISEFSIGTNGVLTLLSGSPVTSSGTGPLFLVFDSKSNFLFLGDQTSNTIAVFSVATDGSLTASANSATVGASPSGMVTLP